MSDTDSAAGAEPEAPAEVASAVESPKDSEAHEGGGDGDGDKAKATENAAVKLRNARLEGTVGRMERQVGRTHTDGP